MVEVLYVEFGAPITFIACTMNRPVRSIQNITSGLQKRRLDYLKEVARDIGEIVDMGME